MKRNIKLLSLLLTSAILLTACNTSEGENITEAAENTVMEELTSAAENTEDAEVTENAEETADDFEDRTTVTDKSKFPTDVYGMLEDNISPDEMTEVKNYGEEGSWNYITCNGFAYIAEPTGINYNSIDNADIFNSEDNSFSGSPEKSNAVFKRVNVGDEICGLTVDTASTVFRNDGGNYPEDCKIRWFGGCSVTFKGEQEMSGYIVILNDDEYAVGGVGDIVFIPDGSSQTLPVMNYTSIEQNAEGKWEAVSNRLGWTTVEADIAFKNEYSLIFLGNTADYGDMLEGAEKNKALKADLTIENITMDSDIEWFASVHATIKDIKLK